MPERPRKIIGVYLPEELQEKIKVFSIIEGITKSELITRAVDEYLSNPERIDRARAHVQTMFDGLNDQGITSGLGREVLEKTLETVGGSEPQPE